jgi:hypothetical protein
MIERACELRAPLSNLAKLRPDLPELSGEEWELLEVVAQVLGVFKVASQPLGGTDYPTLNQAVPTYDFILNGLKGFLGERNDEADGREKSAIIDQCNPINQCVLRDAIQAAHDKIHKYYADAWADMYAISVILDPRLKMEYYEGNGWDPNRMAHAKDALLRVVEEYGPAASQSGQADNLDHLGIMGQWMFGAPKRRRLEKGSEVEKYLAVPTIDAHKDILDWWKRHANDYPCLARIARDYLAIPATSVPAERAFSGGADLITNKRGSLSEDTIEACMCLSSWL